MKTTIIQRDNPACVITGLYEGGAGGGDAGRDEDWSEKSRIPGKRIIIMFDLKRRMAECAEEEEEEEDG